MTDHGPKLVGHHVHGLPAIEDGAPVLTVGPAVHDSEVDGQPPSASLSRILDYLASGAETPEAIGRRVLLMQTLSKTPHACRTQRQLARRMRLSPARVNAILRQFLNDLKGSRLSE
jgi:hypothetical protein